MILQGNVFENKQFVLDLPITYTFKIKQVLKQKIIGNRGFISYIVNKNTNYVIRDKTDENETYKSRRAKSYGIPLVTFEYIDDCIKANAILEYQKYLPDYAKEKIKTDFSDGKIQIQDKEKDGKEGKHSNFRFSLVKVFSYKDQNSTGFHLHEHEIAKVTLLRGKKKKNQIPFCILEIHVSKEDKIEEIPKYCVFMHNGIFSPETKVNENKLCRYFNDINETMLAYNHLYKQYVSPPHSMTQSNKLMSKNIGSDLLCSTEWLLGPVSLDPQVKSLINHIWNEAVVDIEDKLSVSLKMLSFDKIETAKMLIWKILCSFQEEEEEITRLWKEFYEVLPHKNQHELKTIVEIKEKLVDFQSVSNMKALNESFENTTNVTTEMKYQALHCNIETLTPDIAEYQKLISQFIKNDLIIIDKIYKVNRYEDSSEYDNSVGNERLFLHPTKVKDLLYFLSRGLSLYGEFFLHTNDDINDVLRDSIEIHFYDSFENCLHEAQASNSRGTRMVLVNKVALGNCSTTHLRNEVKHPEKYDSVHCLSKKTNEYSDFEREKYVIFNNRQQKISYLIEFHLKTDHVTEKAISVRKTEESTLTGGDESDENNSTIATNASPELNQFLYQSEKEKRLKSQLKAEGMPVHLQLKSVHVRASLIDLASEVTVIQEFINNHSETIQGKYIFPLSEKAAVCGFEAFTEGRHFIGRIEEKTEAHQEYHEAVRAGRKAYLMDEESPEVFSVTIGNISPGAVVFIKITYVSELELEGDLIKFHIPESISPVQEPDNVIDNKQLITEANDQKSTDIIQTSIEIFLDMPFPIRVITSYTHKLNVKKTETKAVVKINPNDKFSNGFHMLVGLTEIHSPRMWVEESTSNKTEACMIAFYPEFDIPTCEENEIIIALDSSNSMQGECFANAQIISLLCLHFLPENCKFNVIKFGTVFQELFPIAVTKSLDVIQDAQQFVLASTPEMGDSNIRHLLHSYYLLPPPRNTTRNIFLISDGFFNCLNELFSVAAKHRQHTRIFTFGIGPNCNNHLLRGLAISGGGGFERFDKKQKYKWKTKVKNQIDLSFEPVLTDVMVDWQTFEYNQKLIQVPNVITTIFNGARLIVYGLISNCNLAVLKANVKGYDLSSVVYTSELAKTKGNTVHRLTTRALVDDWSFGNLHLNRTKHEIMKRNLKPYIIELSKIFGIVTPLTSFLAVEDKDESIDKYAPCDLKEILDNASVDFLPEMRYEKEKVYKCGEFNNVENTHYNLSSSLSSPPENALYNFKSVQPQSPPSTHDALSSASPSLGFKAYLTETHKYLTSPAEISESEVSLTHSPHNFATCRLDEELKRLTEQNSDQPIISSPQDYEYCETITLRKKKPKRICEIIEAPECVVLHKPQRLTEIKRYENEQEDQHECSEDQHEIYEKEYDDLGEKTTELYVEECVKKCILKRKLKRKKCEKIEYEEEGLERLLEIESVPSEQETVEQISNPAEGKLGPAKKDYSNLLSEKGKTFLKKLTSSIKSTANENDQAMSEKESLSLGFGLPFVSNLLATFPQKWWFYKNISMFSSRQRELSQLCEESLNDESCKDIQSLLDYCTNLGGINPLQIPSIFEPMIEFITDFLEDRGIKSLPVSIQEATISLLASLTVVLAICEEIVPDLLPLNLNNIIFLREQAHMVIETLCEKYPEYLQFQFYGLLIYITGINHRYPLMNHILELGNSWETGLANILLKL